MNERIKILRKKLNLTQQGFADRLKIKRGAIANYELGRNEPIDAVISLICREFNVSETWLRTGEGEMFRKISEADELEQIFAAISVSDDELIKRVIRAYWRLTDSEKAGVRELIDNLVEESGRSSEPPAQDTTGQERTEPDTTGQERTRGEKSLKDWTEADIEAEVSEYRRELFEEKRRAESESASTASSISGSKLA